MLFGHKNGVRSQEIVMEGEHSLPIIAFFLALFKCGQASVNCKSGEMRPQNFPLALMKVSAKGPSSSVALAACLGSMIGGF